MRKAAFDFRKTTAYSRLMLETPRQLAARFERGEIDRTEFQSQMAIHARELIAEIEEDHQNPMAAWIESRLAKASVKKLRLKHTDFRIREILTALSESPDFPLAKYLWNASHRDVPLHCFFRIRREPVFQILFIREEADMTEIQLEFLRPRNRTCIVLTRDSDSQLRAPSFFLGQGESFTSDRKL
jgi:hypothetical protein